MSHPPLISVPVLRPIAIRAALMAIVGALCGLTAGVIAGFGPSVALIGLWWGFMILPLGFVERWAERHEDDLKTKLRMAAIIIASTCVLIALGGLQYQYGIGVVRGGEIASGYKRLLWIVDRVQWRDGLVFVVILTPFVASSLARRLRLPVQLGVVLGCVAVISLPLLQFCDHMGGKDRPITLAIVVAAGLTLPLAATASDRISAQVWPPDPPLAGEDARE